MSINSLNKESLDELLEKLNSLKKNISISFIEMGIILKKIRDEKLYLEKDFKTFSEFIKESKLELTPVLIDRFISIVEDQNIKNVSLLDISKINEIAKIDPVYRNKILYEPIKINGKEKKINELSLNELKKISQDLKRQGKHKCERCGRWVESVKELDGKLYGAGSKHSCYDKEIEERRYIEKNAIPAPQLDNVLNEIKSSANIDNDLEVSLSESIYRIYGQFIYQHKINSEELTIDSLQKEKEIVEKFINLLKNRLKDIKDTISLISKEINNLDC